MSNTEKNFRLNKSKVFCMAPWVSINNNPNGDILPCCVARDGVFGNLYKDSIEDIWNNEKYKEFRKNSEQSLNELKALDEDDMIKKQKVFIQSIT